MVLQFLAISKHSFARIVEIAQVFPPKQEYVIENYIT